MIPKIDEDALLRIQGCGPNPPPAARLKAAAEYVVERTEATQIILFGSAARGEFAPESDFDFLAVGTAEPGRRMGTPERLEHPTTGDEIHVLLTDRNTIEERRWIVGTVYSEAMNQGRTVFSKRSPARIPTEQDPGGKTDPMVRKTMERLTEAPVYVRHARSWLKSAEFLAAEDEPEWPVVCKHLQEAGERALKAVHIAKRSLVVHVHGMRQAWEQAENLGERFPIEKNDRILDEITLYGGEKGYGTPSGWNPKEVAEEFGPIAKALVEYSEKRVPEIVAEHERTRNRRQEKEASEVVLRPSAETCGDKPAETAEQSAEEHSKTPR